jgi:hypothetical protein
LACLDPLEKIMNSKSRRFLVTALLFSGIAAAAIACAEPTEDTEDDSDLAAVRTRSSLNPPPGTQDNALDIKLVLDAWKKVKADFYDSKQGYTKTENGASPPASEVTQCLSACPNYYSDLVCHYYCWHPSYAQVSPNVRGCLTYLARGAAANGTPIERKDPATKQLRALYYPEIYDYCLYAEKDGKGYDAVLNYNSPPPWDEAIINANKAAGRKIGVFKWIDDNEAKAFKYVMYTWYNPFAFKLEDQEKAINAFYGVTLTNPNYTSVDTADVAECNAKRPRRTSDPYDGTHCSERKVLPYPLDKHPNYDTINAYMKTL